MENEMNDQVANGQSLSDDWKAVSSIVETLKDLSDESKLRILNTVCTFLNLSFQGGAGRGGFSNARPANQNSEAGPAHFSEDRSLTAKEFLMEKLPKTDVERVACLAYYLATYMDTPHFKTIDISKLNTEAAQRKFANAAKAVDNAAQAGYLVPSPTKGHKQLSAAGERFVQALPDREEAKNVLAHMKPRKNSKGKAGAKQSKTPDDIENE